MVFSIPSSRLLKSTFLSVEGLAGVAAATLLPVVAIGVAFAPVPTALLLPWLALGLAAVLLAWVLRFPNPTRLSKLPRWLTVLTLLRLFADLGTSALLALGMLPEITDLSERTGGLALTVALALALQLAAILSGYCQAGYLKRCHAYFVLDALPGKQMAIDADAYSGCISAQERQDRQQALQRTLDLFDYLSRAGAFCRIDTAISVLILSLACWEGAGLWQSQQIGVLEMLLLHNVSASLCGLLLLGTLATTQNKLAKSANLWTVDPDQGGHYQQRCMEAVGLLLCLYVASRWPIEAQLFLLTVGLLVWGAGRAGRNDGEEEDDRVVVSDRPVAGLLSVELSRTLLSWVDPKEGAPLFSKIAEIREALKMELGFLVPGVTFRENLGLPRHQYRIVIRGQVVSTGTVLPGYKLALGPDQALRCLPGPRVLEPVYSLPAVWVDNGFRDIPSDCLLFDPLAVLCSDLCARIRAHAGDLLSVEEIRERAGLADADGVDDTDWEGLRSAVGEVLSEGVSVTNWEALLPLAQLDCSPAALATAVRLALSHRICQQLSNASFIIEAVSLEGQPETALAAAVVGERTRYLARPLRGPERDLVAALATSVELCRQRGTRPIFLTSLQHRSALAWWVRSLWPDATVIARQEVATGYRLALSWLPLLR
jgi:flagellar biosynthesis protein FlhA